MPKTKSAGDEIVTLDRRSGPRTNSAKSIDGRTKLNRRSGEASPEQVAKLISEEKKKVKVQRRRQIDPTTCERDYSEDEIAFMQAMDEYKRKNGRMFPTCSEILEVVRSIGYAKVNDPRPVFQPASDELFNDAR
jgi:hypothetical protein